MATEPRPDDVTCPTCNGMGFESSAQKMGWRCTSCNGSGKLIDGARMAKILKVLEAYIDEDPKLINK